MLEDELQAAESQNLPVNEIAEDAQTAQAITKRLDALMKRAKRARRRLEAGMAVLGLSVVLSCSLLSHPGAYFVEFFAVAGWIGIVLNFWIWFRTSPKFDAEELASSCGVQAVPLLFSALEYIPFGKGRQAIHSALAILLPQMKASDKLLLTSNARNHIYIWLGGTTGFVRTDIFREDLRIAALKALEQVGDARDIFYVKRLVNGKARNSSQQRIKQAAMDCLPMLRANCGEVEAARTLLRASHSAQADPDTLLRPAAGAGNTESKELLRGAKPPV